MIWKETRFFIIAFFGYCRMAIMYGGYEVSTLECAAIFNMFERVAASQNSHI